MRHSYLGWIVAFALLAPVPSSAGLVHVTVKGVGSLSPRKGQSFPTPGLGSGGFTADYVYDDGVAKTAGTSLYKGAVKWFRMSFDSGSVFTASGGDITFNKNEFSISSLSGVVFPELDGRAYSNVVRFKLAKVQGTPLMGDHLPSAEELVTNYKKWHSWFSYGGDVNGLMLAHTGFSAAPEPPAPWWIAVAVALLIAAAGVFLVWRKRTVKTRFPPKTPVNGHP